MSSSERRESSIHTNNSNHGGEVMDIESIIEVLRSCNETNEPKIMERLVLPKLVRKKTVLSSTLTSKNKLLESSTYYNEFVQSLQMNTKLFVNCIEISKYTVDALTIEQKEALFYTIGKHLRNLQDVRLGYTNHFLLELNVFTKLLEQSYSTLQALRFFRMKLIPTETFASASASSASTTPTYGSTSIYFPFFIHRHNHKKNKNKQEYVQFLNSLSQLQQLQKFIYDRAEIRIPDDYPTTNHWEGVINAICKSPSSQTLQVLYIREVQLSLRRVSQIQIPIHTLRNLFLNCIHLRAVTLKFLKLTNEHIITISQTLIETSNTNHVTNNRTGCVDNEATSSTTTPLYNPPPSSSSSLELLDVSENIFGDDGCFALCDYVKLSTCKLQHLNVRYNNITHNGIQAILHAIHGNRHNNSIQHLDVSSSSSSSSSSTNSSHTNNNHHHPSMDNTTHQTANLVSKLLLLLEPKRNPTYVTKLTYLNISKLNLKIQDVKTIVQSLKYNTTLQHLNISGNEINDEICMEIANSLTPSHSKDTSRCTQQQQQELSALKTLDISRLNHHSGIRLYNDNHTNNQEENNNNEMIVTEIGYYALINMLKENYALEQLVTWCDKKYIQDHIHFYLKLNRNGLRRNLFQCHHNSDKNCAIGNEHNHNDDDHDRHGRQEKRIYNDTNRNGATNNDDCKLENQKKEDEIVVFIDKMIQSEFQYDLSCFYYIIRSYPQLIVLSLQ